jgi:hypothetical protein
MHRLVYGNGSFADASSICEDSENNLLFRHERPIALVEFQYTTFLIIVKLSNFNIRQLDNIISTFLEETLISLRLLASHFSSEFYAVMTMNRLNPGQCRMMSYDIINER